MIGRIIKWTIIYTLLIGGAIVFSLPFAWMAATSGKVDRELFSKELRFLPQSPVPATRSPYIDTRFFQHIKGPYQAELPADLEKLARGCGFVLPTSLPADESFRQIGRGLYERLSRTVSADTWAQSPDAVLAVARRQVDAKMVGEALDLVQRRLLIGQIRIRSEQFQEIEVGRGEPFDRRLENNTPDHATVVNWSEDSVPCASVNYDFGSAGSADKLTFSRTAELDFDPAQLGRVQLNIRPDDSWHELTLTVEYGGRRFRAERAVPLANCAWQTIIWQPPGPDDRSPTKMKTWVLLKPADSSGDYSPSPAGGGSGRGDLRFMSDPKKIKLTFELARATPAGAWWSKLTRNYRLVQDQVPLWRYLRTSLFLVIANVVLTVFACSLVAYSFARLRWPGRDFCFMLMLATMMIPGQVTMIPHFLIWKHLGAYNTLTPLWLPSAFGNAFFIFLLRQFFRTIPRDLEDAARLDGCGFLRIYWHLMLPLVKPSLAAIAILTFMGTWNDFMSALVYIADQRLYPLAFGLYAFSVQVGNDPLLTMAGSMLMTVPVIVIFFFAQKYFIQGITLTGLKG